jgi:hypothetical protein
MKNKLSIVSALCLVAALTLSACGGKKQAATPPKTDATPAAIAPGEPAPAAAADPAKPEAAPAEQPKGGW